jgi:hypothetical protein
MGIDTPRHIAILIGFIVFTVFAVVLMVRFSLRHSGPAKPFSDSMFIGLVFLSLGLCMSLLFYQALDSGVTYSLGKPTGTAVEVSREPIKYWVGVTIWYSLGVLFLSVGIAALLNGRGIRRKTKRKTKEDAPPYGGTPLTFKLGGITHAMKLETDSLALRFDQVTEEQLRAAFKDDARRGALIILSQQPTVYMQALGEAEGPYTLEYQDGDDQPKLQAREDLRKEDVLRAFLWYLAGDPRWRTDFPWRKPERKPWWIYSEHSPTKTFTGPWLIATLGYVVVLLALYVYSNTHPGVMRLPDPMAAIALVFVSFGLLPIYTGVVRLRDGEFYRSKNPIWYWACVATILTIGIALFLAGIGVIGT